ACAVVAVALLSRRRASAGSLAMVATAGVLLFAPHSFWARTETITSYDEDYSVQGRMQAWQVAFHIVRDHPLVGVGEAAFLEAWSQYAPIDAGHRRYVAHNLFLEVLGQLGIIALFGYVCFIIAAFWSAWRARHGEVGGAA